MKFYMLFLVTFSLMSFLCTAAIPQAIITHWLPAFQNAMEGAEDESEETATVAAEARAREWALLLEKAEAFGIARHNLGILGSRAEEVALRDYILAMFTEEAKVDTRWLTKKRIIITLIVVLGIGAFLFCCYLCSRKDGY